MKKCKEYIGIGGMAGGGGAVLKHFVYSNAWSFVCELLCERAVRQRSDYVMNIWKIHLNEVA